MIGEPEKINDEADAFRYCEDTECLEFDAPENMWRAPSGEWFCRLHAGPEPADRPSGSAP